MWGVRRNAGGERDKARMMQLLRCNAGGDAGNVGQGNVGNAGWGNVSDMG